MQVEQADKTAEKAEVRMEELVTKISALKKSLVDAERVAAITTAVSSEQQKTIDRLDNELLELKTTLKEVTVPADLVTRVSMNTVKSQFDEIK